MKKVIILFLLAFVAEYALSQNTPINYILSGEESQLLWKANYVVSGGHEGTLQFISGIATTNDQEIIKGEFIIDINSIENTDIKPDEDGNGLEEHLRSDDFFSAVQFPGGIFSILKTEFLSSDQQHTVTGFLTLKGITHQISFPATIKTEKETVKVQAELTFDRTRWGINYQSKSIFSDLKDGVISDYIYIRLNLTLRRESARPK